MENHPRESAEEHGLVRGFGLTQAVALNMSNMVGVGPFITIPLIIASMGGPQCMLGWLLGAVPDKAKLRNQQEQTRLRNETADSIQAMNQRWKQSVKDAIEFEGRLAA